jgi:hypothetical protein
MPSLTFEGASLASIELDMMKWLRDTKATPLVTPELESKTLASGATLLKDTTVEETTTPKKRGPKPKETVTVEPTPVQTVQSAPANVAPAPGVTFESMKKALQELAGKHKTNEEGMTAVSKLLLDKFQLKMVRDVPADKYQAVQDAAVAAMGNVGADPFKV